MRRPGLALWLAAALLVALVCAGPASGLAASPTPLGLGCVDENGVQFCQGDGAGDRVTSFDGVPLDVDVTLPPANQGNGPFPTIVMLHGYGNSKTDFESDNPDGDPNSSTPGRLYHWNNVWFARRGYAVVNYTARGFGKSCGAADQPKSPACAPVANGSTDPSAGGWIHLKDRRREAHDTQHLLGMLVDEGYAKPDALGATGISYGGGETIELAYLRDRVQKVSDDPGEFEPWVSPVKKIPMRLAAAYPRWPWSDLVASLLPNGRFLDYKADTADKSRTPPGVPIQSYIEGLYALGHANGFYAPAGADSTADIMNWNARVLAGEPYTDPTAQAILNEIFSFHQGFGTPGSDPAPLLIQNGWTDDLFPPSEALRVYNSLRAANPQADVALQFGDLGHARGSNKTNADRAFNDQATHFFDKHLKGSSEKPPPAPGSVTAFTQTCPKTASVDAGGPFTAGTWPALHPSAVRFGFPDEQTVTSVGGNPETGQAYDPITGGGDACKQVDDETAPGTAVYRLPVSTGYTLLGLPTVHAEIETTGPNGQLDSRLWDVAPDGKQTLVSRGVYRLLDDQPGPIDFQLHGNGWRFEKGHVAKLELLGQDAPYLRPSNGTFQVALKNVVVELPTLGAPKSDSTFGVGVRPGLGVGGTVPIGPSGGGTKPRLRVTVKPRRTRAGRRTRFVFRVRARSVRTGKLHNVRRARVRFAGRRYRTGKRGRVVTRRRFHHAGRRTARATKKGYRRGSVRVRVLHRRRG